MSSVDLQSPDLAVRTPAKRELQPTSGMTIGLWMTIFSFAL